MQQLQQLLEKYWSGEYALSDIQMILDRLEVSDKELYDAMKAEFEKETIVEARLLEKQTSELILKRIHLKMRRPVRYFSSKLIKLSYKNMMRAAAALILVFVSLVALRELNLKNDNRSSGAEISDEPSSRFLTIQNNGDGESVYTLSDSSRVVLFQGSALSYKENFDSASRSLRLSGKAYFKVAKDASRPFTVYADGVSVTALGTEFTVDAILHPGKVLVKLLEGKVAVHSASKENQLREVFLNAGQECAVDILRRELIVSDFNEKKAKAPPRNKIVSINEDTKALEFYKESLHNIFKRLSAHFSVDIQYDKKEINNLYFTGQFKASDSLPMILTMICNTNDLFFDQDGRSVFIRK